MPSLALAQQGGDGFAGASVSIRFADHVDAVAGAGLAFQDFPTQSVTATASASLSFQGDPNTSGALTASVTVGIAFQNDTEFAPRWIEYAASPAVVVSFEGPTLPAPTITFTSATAGVQGTSISNFTVTGTNFDPSSSLFFTGTGVVVDSYSSRTATQIVANVSIALDAATTARDVVVLNSDLQQATVQGGFQVLAAPNLLFNISTGGTTFPQGAIVPFGAIVFDASNPNVPVTSSSVGVRLTVVGPTSATVYGPTPLSFNPITGQFTGTLNTSGLLLGRYEATFTFSRPDGIVVGVRSASFDLVGSLSLTLSPNKPTYARGESVGLTGHVQDPSGGPLVGLAVALRIALGEVTREYNVFSNAQGNYGFVFTPPLTEAGTYVATARALNGGAGGEAETTFVVHGLMLDPASTTVSMSMNSTLQVPLQLRNIGESNLTELTLAVQDLDLGDGITGALNITSIPALAPGATQDLTLTISAPAGSAPSFPVLFKVLAAAAQGVVDSASVSVTLRNVAGVPIVDPPTAAVGMSPGASRFLSFTLRNEGVTPILNARVSENPEVFDWITLANDALGSLAPGEAKAFSVSFLPPADLALGLYAVQVQVVSSQGTIVVPINVEITPSLVRPVSVQVSDDAAMDVAGAAVQLVSTRLLTNGTGGATQDSPQIYEGTSDSSGRLSFPAVAAGAYTLRVLAAQHADYQAEVIIEPGSSPQEIEAILSTTVVNFSFKVTRTSITDEYDVALVVTFSTDLIKPALIVSPTRIDLSMPGGGEERGGITITNSHTQTAVTNIEVDARKLRLSERFTVRLCTDGTNPCTTGDPSVFLIESLGPGQTVRLKYLATLTPGNEPPSQSLDSILVTGHYTYSLRGRAMPGETVTPVLVMYRKPDSLRMFPPITFLNDERAGSPGVLQYTGTTTRIALENLREASLEFKEFNGQDPSDRAPVEAIQFALPANILPDQVPLELLLSRRTLWKGDLESNQLQGLESQTTFDIGELVSLVESSGHELGVVSSPPYIAIVGEWSGVSRTPEGFVFPTSVTTIRPHEVQVVESGWSPCGLCLGSTTILGGTAAPQPFNNHGIVKIQIDQKVSLEREAFDATLEIFPAVASLDNFTATMSILDAGGNDASDRFVVIPTLPPSPIVEHATAHWLIVPKESAGGTTAAGFAYTATAHIVYSVRGVAATFDTAPELFTVLPLAKLRLDYTIPYVVMNDIPFNLDVRVTNTGFSPAANVTIDSAQPRIIENLNNLPISFSIEGFSPTGQEADFQEREDELKIELPPIAPGDSKNAFWRMNATRRGFIIDFASTVRQRSFKGVELDPIVEVFTHFAPALGGRVTPGCNLGPLTVSLQGTSARTITDANSDYYLTNLTAGSYLLTFARGNGNPVTVRVDILPDQPTDFVDLPTDLVDLFRDLDSDGDHMSDCLELAGGRNPDDASDGRADVSVTITATPGPVTVGNDLTYTIGVRNDGPAAATGVTLIDTLPEGVEYRTASSASCAPGGGAVACSIGSLAVGSQAIVTIVVRPASIGTVENVVAVSANEPDLAQLNNAVSISTQVVQEPDSDGDGVPDAIDNCPARNNLSPTDSDHDGMGDACDPTPTSSDLGPDRKCDADREQDRAVNCDTDGDALPDLWEVLGYDHGRDGTVDVPLYKMGADPNVRDIFVEVDYMDCRQSGSDCPPDHTGSRHLKGVSVGATETPLDEVAARSVDVIDPLALTQVIDAFFQKGIHLHVDAGKTFLMDKNTGATWGDLSNADALRHAATLGSLDLLGYNWSGTLINTIAFDTLRKQDEARKPIFHYVIAAHALPRLLFGFDTGLKLGVARETNEGKQGSDFALAHVPSVLSDASDPGRASKCEPLLSARNEECVAAQAGTFMHELGHNLGLKHGGFEEMIFKPNYLSVMNYAFGLGLPLKADEGNGNANFLIDYSKGELNQLDQNALNERTGLTGLSSVRRGVRTLHSCGTAALFSQMRVVPVGPDIDWNCSGENDDDIDDVIVRWQIACMEVTGFNTTQCNYDVLKDHDDWFALIFGGGAIGGFNQNEQAAEISAVEPPIEPLIEAQFADNDADLIRDIFDNCPGIANPDQLDTDGDGYGDVCEPNHAPMGQAGTDQLIEATSASGGLVTLDGSGSMDPDGDALSFAWGGPFGQLDGPVITATLALGVHTIALNVSDGRGGSATDTVVVTVRDTRSPVISISTPVNGTYTFGQPVAATYGCTDEGSGIATCVGPMPNGANIDTGSLGPKTFTVNARDNVGNTSSLSVNYTVVAAPTTGAITVAPSTQQYSDTVALTATLSPATLAGQAPASTVTFMVGSQPVGMAPLTLVNGALTGTLANVRLREPTPFGTAPTGQIAPGPHIVTAIFGGVNSNFIVTNPTTTLTITSEDARATYTGALFASTACVTCSTATVTLSATVQDISAVRGDPATDATEGDIRNATVTFQIVETGQTMTGVPIGLVNTGDTKTGTATTNVTVDLGAADAMALTVRVMVDGYYTSPVEQTVVTVAKPLGSSSIAGGGYLTMMRSAGLYPGQAGSKNNFGFSVKYNKSGTNLQGNINTLVRNNGRVYQIKGNAITSLSTNPGIGTATFNGKANIQDVTDPLNPLSIDGNATLQVTITDKGEPGSADTIGITLWNKSGGLWFSSNWSGTRTLEQLLTGGNLVIR